MKRYAEWSKEYPNYLILKQAGFFYMAWGRSAEVLNEILDYKLAYTKKRNTPFTGGTSLEKIINALVANCINYIVIEADAIVEECEFEYCEEVFYRKEDFSNSVEDNESGFSYDTPEFSDEEKLQYIDALLDGIDLNSGEILDDDHIINEDIVRDILNTARKAIVRKQNRERNKRAATGARWTDEEDERLLEEYRSNIRIKEIAEMHERSTGAIKSRLLRLGAIEL